MYAYHFETIVPPNHELLIKSLPFRPGEAIEVIILTRHPIDSTLTLFPLRNSVLKYDDPTEPVAEADWGVLQ